MLHSCLPFRAQLDSVVDNLLIAVMIDICDGEIVSSSSGLDKLNLTRRRSFNAMEVCRYLEENMFLMLSLSFNPTVKPLTPSSKEFYE